MPTVIAAHELASIQAVAQAVHALPNPCRNVQTALRMLNDATGLLQKG
jgi:hypothetical protein